MLNVNEKCISCGRCAEACPAYIISLKDGTPEITGDGCIKCGHCEAICPENALRNTLMDSSEREILEIDKFPVIDDDTAELFLRSRRSMRCFKDEEVSEDETRRLLDIGRYAQTGGNTQSVDYMVVSSSKINQIRPLFMEYLKNHSEPRMKAMYRMLKNSDNDMIFRGAPMCILALTAKENPYLATNARYALTYMELLAPSLGLGTCWAGFLEQFASMDTPELRQVLEIPEGMVVSSALLYGYPKYRYYRTAARNKPEIYWR